MREGGHTSQLLRMKQRDLATDLSGPKPPGESLTPRSNSATASDTVDSEFGVFSSTAALGSRVSSRRTASGPRSGKAGVSTSSERSVGGSGRTNRVHVLSGSEIEGVDGEEPTPSSSPLRPLPTATLTSGFRCECIWLASTPSTSGSPPS